MAQKDDEGFWIRSEPTLDGKAFVVTMSLDGDYAVTLTPTRANAYAGALLGAAAEAEYDAAVLRQITERLGLDDDVAGQIVIDLRAERPVRSAAGLTFVPGVSVAKRHPFITIERDGEPVGQFDTPSARRHALHVLEAVPGADLDAAYLKVLRGTVGIKEETARQVVEDIVNYRVEWSVSDQ